MMKDLGYVFTARNGRSEGQHLHKKHYSKRRLFERLEPFYDGGANEQGLRRKRKTTLPLLSLRPTIRLNVSNRIS